jgi:hypothetical protein
MSGCCSSRRVALSSEERRVSFSLEPQACLASSDVRMAYHIESPLQETCMEQAPPVVPTLQPRRTPTTAREVPHVLRRAELARIQEGHEALAESNNKRNERIKQARQLVGDFHSDLLKELKSNKERRPILAIVAGFPRKLLEEAFGIKVPEREYTNLKIHSRFPGPGKPVQPTEIFRNRIKDEVIVALLACLESSDNLQRTAFGTKVVEILGGHDFVTIENIERNKKLQDIAAHFVVSLFDESEMVAEGRIPESADRCMKIERDSFRYVLIFARVVVVGILRTRRHQGWRFGKLYSTSCKKQEVKNSKHHHQHGQQHVTAGIAGASTYIFTDQNQDEDFELCVRSIESLGFCY